MELFIMFVYDTQRCQKEDDDPQDAVLYFHPTWVSDQQKLALCGQLMGATQFFLSAFSCPRVIALNSGKFVVQQLGQYILSVGTDRNIPDWILQHRADMLLSLVQFYHKDLDTISSVSLEEGSFFAEKLHHIFETYVPIIQYAGNIFGTIPTVKLPKSASNVYLEALQLLQCFQAKGVLGGTVLYQNKVVATQLSSDLTKRLVSADPYRIKSTAEVVVTPFHLPVGVQLLYVYVRSTEYKKLSEDTKVARAALQNAPNFKASQKRGYQGKGSVTKEQMSMKRDTSRIFTVPEEEGELDDIHAEINDNIVMESTLSESISEVIEVSESDSGSKEEEQTFQESQDQAEYKSEINGEAESEKNCVSKIDENLFAKADTVLSLETERGNFKPLTPMENININKVLHAKVLSICCEGESDSKKIDLKNSTKKQLSKKMKSSLQESKIVVKQLVNKDEIHSSSMNDLHNNSRSSVKAIPMRCYSFGLPQLTHEMCEELENSEPKKEPFEKYFYNTIADPLHPCFRNDGLPISRSLFHEYVANHYHLLKAERSVDTSPLENVSGSFQSMSETDGQNSSSTEQNSSKVPQDTDSGVNLKVELRKKDAVSSKQEVNRRSLTLPLKSTTSNGSVDVTDSSSEVPAKPSWDKFGCLESPLARTKPFNALQLTPLMSKLSILAMEERTGPCFSRDATPCDVREIFLSGRNGENKASRRPSIRSETNDINSSKGKNCLPESEKAVLYVCGQQNMALLLLMDEKLGQDPDLIHFLWEASLSSLTQLETHLQKCLEHLPQGDGMEPYSYICLDPSWDMLQRGGSWGALELDVVSCLHFDFTQAAGLTEVVLRCEDSTVYGYQCGRTEVFYQQPVGSTPGLPTPADLMGTVPLKAKRRLERDHGILLL